MTIGPKFRAGHEIEAKTFGRNLQAFRRDRLCLNDKRFAEQLGVSASAVRNWEAGKALPSDDHVAAIITMTDGETNPDWLLNGKGLEPSWLEPSWLNEPPPPSEPPPAIPPEPGQMQFAMGGGDGKGFLTVTVSGGFISLTADSGHFRVELIEGGVKVVMI
jgi:hypothetical protein